MIHIFRKHVYTLHQSQVYSSLYIVVVVQPITLTDNPGPQDAHLCRRSTKEDKDEGTGPRRALPEGLLPQCLRQSFPGKSKRGLTLKYESLLSLLTLYVFYY